MAFITNFFGKRKLLKTLNDFEIVMDKVPQGLKMLKETMPLVKTQLKYLGSAQYKLELKKIEKASLASVKQMDDAIKSARSFLQKNPLAFNAQDRAIYAEKLDKAELFVAKYLDDLSYIFTATPSPPKTIKEYDELIANLHIIINNLKKLSKDLSILHKKYYGTDKYDELFKPEKSKYEMALGIISLAISNTRRSLNKNYDNHSAKTIASYESKLNEIAKAKILAEKDLYDILAVKPTPKQPTPKQPTPKQSCKGLKKKVCDEEKACKWVKKSGCSFV